MYIRVGGRHYKVQSPLKWPWLLLTGLRGVAQALPEPCGRGCVCCRHCVGELAELQDVVATGHVAVLLQGGEGISGTLFSSCPC